MVIVVWATEGIYQWVAFWVPWTVNNGLWNQNKSVLKQEKNPLSSLSAQIWQNFGEQ